MATTALKLTVDETRSAMSVAWARARKAARQFGGRVAEYFRAALAWAYETAREYAAQAAYEAASPAERSLIDLQNRLARAEYIDNYEQYRGEVAHVTGLIRAAEAALVAEKEADAAWLTECEAIEGHAEMIRSAEASASERPDLRVVPKTAWDLAIAATTSPVDPATRVDLRGICGERRYAA